MTEATFKEKKNKQASTDNRISTHPAYTEYAWDSLVNNGKRGTASAEAAATGRKAPMNTSTVAKRPISGVGVQVGTPGKEKTVSAGAKSKTSSSSISAEKKSRSKTAEKIKKKSIVAMHTVVVEKKYAFPMSVVLIAACFTVLIMAIITTSVQINEITSENATLQRTYTELVNEENELRLLLETRDDLRVVETVAKEELGMVKKDQVDRYYLTVHKEDRIEIIEDKKEADAGLFDGIMSFGGSLVERIRGFFDM